MKRKVDGRHVLYHYLQKELQSDDVWLFQMLASRLVASLGVWFRPSLYERMPILVPYAVRDPTCRPRKPHEKEEWGSPDPRGYFRDDNTLIKRIPASLRIRSPLGEIYNGRFLGSGFVASHVWRLKDSASGTRELVSRDPWTYSFVPNLVWLPAQVSKLTDRMGSFTQLYLQALSTKLYREVSLIDAMRPFAEKAWSRLPLPQGIPDEGLPDPSELSYFEETPRFVNRRLSKIASVADALLEVSSGRRPSDKIVSSRYTRGLPDMDRSTARSLSETLNDYVAAITDALKHHSV